MSGPLRMILMVGALFAGFKLASRPRRRILAYSLLWPGMDPAPFAGERRSDPKAWCLGIAGLLTFEIGAAIVAAAVLIDWPPVVRAWLVIFGALTAVHLGLFDFLAGFWRWRGFPVERICPSPWRSRSLSEFWGVRWNRAFHVLARDRIYRPLVRRWGRGPAMAAVFLASGLFHELAISVPAGGGWGLPTLYFALHGGLVMLERRGLRLGRWLTAAAVLLPLPILFHGPFLTRVILPMVTP